jgi:hypothetical protein
MMRIRCSAARRAGGGGCAADAVRWGGIRESLCGKLCVEFSGEPITLPEAVDLSHWKY